MDFAPQTSVYGSEEEKEGREMNHIDLDVFSEEDKYWLAILASSENISIAGFLNAKS